MKKSLLLLSAGLIGAVLLFSSVPPAPQAATEHLIEQMIANAKTKADHEALAGHYEAEAQALQEKANTHKRMSAAYRMNPGKGAGAGFTTHCDRLIAPYKAAAEENLELAKLHRQMATEAGQ